jgi:hypothetical protein
VVPPDENLFKPDCQDCPEVSVNETQVEVNGTKVFVRAAVDCEIIERYMLMSRPVVQVLMYYSFFGKGWNSTAVAHLQVDRGP